MRRSFMCAMLFCCVFVMQMWAQEGPASENASTTCTFADGQEVTLRYNLMPAGTKEQPPKNTPWGPGGVPMYLFAQTAITANNVSIEPGAYSLYVIMGKEPWTIIVNKDVTPGSKYNAAQDIVRMPMQSGDLPVPVKQFKPSFVHSAPQQCTLRIYFEKTGAWAEFHEK